MTVHGDADGKRARRALRAHIAQHSPLWLELSCLKLVSGERSAKH